MARSSACVRSAIRKVSARFQPHSSTSCAGHPTLKQPLAAKYLPAAGHTLLGRKGGQDLVVKWSNSSQDWRRCSSPLNHESRASCAIHNRKRSSSASVKLLDNPSAPPFHRCFSIWGAGKENKARDENQQIDFPVDSYDRVSTSGAEEAPVVQGEWTERVYAKLMDGIKVVEDTFYVVYPRVEDVLEKYPIIAEIAAPVGVFTGAWIILPRVLRRLHRYVEQGSAAFYNKGLSPVPHVHTPYEQSMWQAMELPCRLFATILTMLQVGRLVAPNAMDAHHLTQFWAGGGVVCIVWFLHNWKSNVLKRLLTAQPLTVAERERYLTIDKVSSAGLVFIGALGLAEAYGLQIQSLLAVGGIGGVATAFAAKDILGNMLTGVSLSFSKPFSVGDQIKAGSVEGKVEEVGLHSTMLLNTEKNPIIVPNSFFQSQVIVNKSRAPWRALSVKIPVPLQDFEKVPTFTREIREMLNRHPQVHLGEDKPRCSIAQFTTSSIEIAISCNVKPMSKDEFFLVQQSILLEAAAIIHRSGAGLGGQV